MWRSSWLVALACSGCFSFGESSSAPDAAFFDASVDAPPFMTAAHGPQPQVVPLAGPVLAAPLVVPVFFTGDSMMQSEIEGFLAALPGSSYWSATTSEYGIGDIAIAPTVVDIDPPPTSDSDLQMLITTNSAGLHGWPANTPNTIYAVFLPDGITETTPFGMSCTDFGGYHDETPGGVIYALLPRCDSGLPALTSATSHELIEASSDPFPFSNPAYQNTDAAHAVWGLSPGGELGDMCEYVQDAFAELDQTGYSVQRTWSNTAALTSHDPCVPALPMPYVAAEPVFTEQLPFVDAEGNNITTPGVSVATGTAVQVEVDLFSDVPTTSWTVQAYDTDQILLHSQTELQFMFDQPIGNNGSKLELTIYRVAPGTNGGSVLLIESYVGGESVSEWWGWIGN